MPKKKKIKVKIHRKKTPRFGSGILADSVKRAERGKIDCYGLFTYFRAWAYPCSRSWTTVVTLFDLPRTTTPVSFFIKRHRTAKIKTLATLDVEPSDEPIASTITVPVQHTFTRAGTYVIECTIRNNPNKLQIPFQVRTEVWPEFSDRDENFVRDNPSAPQFLLANVHCDNCEHIYVFEETILPDRRLTGGSQRFPEAGTFECEECGHTLNLKDVQGQLRASLKEMIQQRMRKK